MPTKIRCAVIGLGRIGCILEEDRLREKPCTHAGAISNNPDCRLVAGCDIREDRRQRFASRWKCRQVFTDLNSLLRETDPQLLHVATPPETHSAIVEQAVKHGVPVLICEKPLAENSSAAASIVEAHRSKRIKILTNHERRYSRDYLRVRSRVKEHTYGSLLSVVSRLYMGEHSLVEEVLLNDGTHLVDIIHFLTGGLLHPPQIMQMEDSKDRDKQLSAGDSSVAPAYRGRPSARDPSARDPSERDYKTLLISSWVEVGGPPPGTDQSRQRTAGSPRPGAPQSQRRTAGANLPVSIEVGTGRDHVVFELDLSFTRGRIRVGNGLYEEYCSRTSPYYEGMRSLSKTGIRRTKKTGYFSHMLEDAVCCLQEPNHEPVSSAVDGYQALVFIDSVLRLR